MGSFESTEPSTESSDSEDMPYITPSKLLPNKSLPFDFKFAIICYCPMPKFFSKCKMSTQPTIRYFIHTPMSCVTFCENESGVKFIVLDEVYGGVVNMADIEELHFYGIKTIIGIGFVGSLDPKILVGDNVFGKFSYVEDNSNGYYGGSEKVKPSNDLMSFVEKLNLDHNVGIWTTSAIYREYNHMIKEAVSSGLKVVNMDTSHLYMVSRKLKIRSVYVATVSDTMDKCDLPDAMDQNEESEVIKSQNDLCQRIYDNMCYI